MRIVYLHQYFTTNIEGTRSFEAARRLVRRGHQVEMVTTDRTSAPKTRSWRVTDEDGIRVHWLPVRYSNHMTYPERLRAFAKFAWGACRKAASLRGDVVFATSTPLTIAIPAMYATRGNRAPMVFEVRDLWPAMPIAVGALRNQLLITAARRLEHLAYHRSAHVIALSPGMKAGIVAAGYPEHQIAVLPNACDFDVFDIGEEPGCDVRRGHQWLGNRPLVIYAGTIGLVNGVDYLARVAAHARDLNPEVRFVIIGDGREKDAVRRVAMELRVLDQNFIMLPKMPKADVAKWLSASNVGMSLFLDIPEMRANSANKWFDTLAAGRPVAINYAGWHADLVQESGAGLVLSPHDTRAAARTLVAALADEEWQARARAAARTLAQDRFSRDDQVAELERILSQVVENHRKLNRV